MSTSTAGAWVLGNARLDDGITPQIAKECQVLAVAVDFHNASDDRVDKFVDDREAALEWMCGALRRSASREL
ncbi:alpha/beta hydrolase fold domain-containing protein [Rhizobium populisoli]|uniref:alpha/beta hydrolase fold domain-containing protein n=1 Tax=Rhizobium populisoli TaxID=2859785 RepID=UPI001FE3F5B4|nr:alpha/beta hydrolase fold domain-containing protein [Rhizobium populisoli]